VIVMKLRTEERPLDLAFRRILLILVKAVLAKKLVGEDKTQIIVDQGVLFTFLRWVTLEYVY